MGVPQQQQQQQRRYTQIQLLVSPSFCDCPVSSVQECRVTAIATIATIALQLGMIYRKLGRLESKLCKIYLDQ